MMFPQLQEQKLHWLITGGAGFIGSNLAEALLKLNQKVTVLDNLSTGFRTNIDDVLSTLSDEQKSQFTFIEGDIVDPATCEKAVQGVDLVLHQAALGSVPRSMKEPINCHQANVTGFINMLWAAQKAGCNRFVYASSSSVYGDSEGLPKVEEKIGNPLSPYAGTKLVDEIYASIFYRTYGTPTIGLRYFNVFGRRQSPEGQYAAVIPLWVESTLKGEPAKIFGDGETSRDFCYIDNVIQINLRAALTENHKALGEAFNVAVGDRTTLNELLGSIQAGIKKRNPDLKIKEAEYQDFRPGDIRHSLASVDKAKNLLGYEPTHRFAQGIDEAMGWYIENN